MQIFSAILWVTFFVLFMVSFAVQKLLSIIRSHLFVFIFITLEGGSRKILLQFMSTSVLPMFSSRSFKVSSLKSIFIYLFIYLFIYFLRYAGLSLLWPLPLRSTGSGRADSAAMAHGPSRSAACGIFPDRGMNLCPLHQQADSQPLRHQGSPIPTFISSI